jgi:hypothetical protein
MSGNDLLLQHIVPGLGCIIAFVMFSSPLKAVMQVQKQRHLGVWASYAPGCRSRCPEEGLVAIGAPCRRGSGPRPADRAGGRGAAPRLAAGTPPPGASPNAPAAAAPQDLNPLPMVAIWANCTAWLIYAFIKADPYVFFANEPGLLLGIYMTVVCYGYADGKVGGRGCPGGVGVTAGCSASRAVLRCGW